MAAVPLMPLSYAEDVRCINEKLDEDENRPKPRKPTSMERLQACHVLTHNKGNYAEVEQIEKSINCKQSVYSAARKRKNARKEELNAYISHQKRAPWRRLGPPSDDDPRAASSNVQSYISR